MGNPPAFPPSIRLGLICGFAVEVNYSWLVSLSLIAAGLAWQYFPATYDATSIPYLLLGIAAALLFSASLLGHELAHALTARGLGLPVRRVGLFLWGGITDLGQEPGTPLRQLLLAFAGPLASFVFAVLFALFWLISPRDSALGTLAGCLAAANGILAACNLIPAYPLDGGRALRSLIWWEIGSFHSADRIATWIGRGHAVLAFLAGIWLIWIGAAADGIALLGVAIFLLAATAQSLKPSTG